jgi:hypothetical protein
MSKLPATATVHDIRRITAVARIKRDALVGARRLSRLGFDGVFSARRLTNGAWEVSAHSSDPYEPARCVIGYVRS